VAGVVVVVVVVVVFFFFFFVFTTASRQALGFTQHPIWWVLGALSLRVNHLGHEANHSPPSNVEFKDVWRSCTSISPYIFNVWCLVRYKMCLHGVALS